MTLDAFDADGSKKQAKKTEKLIREQQQKAQQQEEEEKKKQKESQISFYESLRQGNLGLLNTKKEQTIG